MKEHECVLMPECEADGCTNPATVEYWRAENDPYDGVDVYYTYRCGIHRVKGYEARSIVRRVQVAP